MQNWHFDVTDDTKIFIRNGRIILMNDDSLSITITQSKKQELSDHCLVSNAAQTGNYTPEAAAAMGRLVSNSEAHQAAMAKLWSTSNA